jgi:hypothetical protein
MGAQTAYSRGVHANPGRPNVLPLAFAFRSPALTHSAIKLRFNSATPPEGVKSIKSRFNPVPNFMPRLHQKSSQTVAKEQERESTVLARKINTLAGNRTPP